ncbi:MAG TPA: protein kinase [Bacteroidota bacterium]|nr:protein kinase [Bacteroidota bacterium]
MKNVNCRYRIIEKLGEGGTGSVYLVEDAMYGNVRRALKTMNVKGMDVRQAGMLRNEFSLLRQFDHPNIVKVQDFGTVIHETPEEENGTFFFTMDLIPGHNLFDSTEHADQKFLTSMAIQIARAIEYIHRHGLIHFDIKPENIIVREVETANGILSVPKIIDFGFAAPSAELLSGTVKGSLHYIAPEIVAGKNFDQKVDLYSFGVTLFQIFTRTFPFDADNPVELLKKHEMEVPPSISKFRPDISPILASLVSDLLEKDPQKRLQSAQIAVDILRRASPGTMLDGVTVPVKKFVGRREELQQLLDISPRADMSRKRPPDGNSRKVVCVVGERGMGKTPLLDEWKRRLQTENSVIVGARCYLRNSPPLEPFRWIIHELKFSLLPRPQPAGTILEKYSSLFATLAPAAANENKQPQTVDFSGEEEKRRFLRSVVDLIIEASAAVPFVMYIDDADSADETSLDLIRALIQSDSHFAPPLVLGCSDLLFLENNLRTFGTIETLNLKGLDDDGIAAVIESQLGVIAMSNEVASAIAKTIGNSPYIVNEFLNQFTHLSPAEAAKELAGAVSAHKTISEFPQTIHDAYERRLLGCSDEERSLLGAISCFRIPVKSKLLERCFPPTASPLSRLLPALVMKGILKLSEGDGKVHFSHSGFRWFIRQHIPDAERVKWHASIAEGLVSSEGDFTEVTDEMIAYHFKEAGINEKAFEYYIRAAHTAASIFSFRESTELLEAALPLTSKQSEQDRTLRQLARQYDLIENYERAERTYKMIVERPIDADPEKYHLFKSLGAVQTRRGELESATESFMNASRHAVSTIEAMEIEDELADLDIARGQLIGARNRCTRAMENLDARSDSTLISSISTKLGIISFYETKFSEGMDHFLKAFSILEHSGDKAKLIAPLLNLGNAYSMQKEYAKALESWTSALHYAEEVGNLHQQGQIHNNIGIAEYEKGHYDAARTHYTEGIRIFRELDNLPGEALCLNNLGEVYFVESEFEKASESWERCLAIYLSIGDASGLVESHSHLSELSVLFNDASNALRHLEEAEQIFQRGNLEAKRPLYYFVRTVVAFEQKDLDHAEEYARRAKESFSHEKNDINYCRLLLLIGKIHRARRHDDDAASCFHEARTLGAELQLHALEAEALMELGVQARMDEKGSDNKPMSYFKEAYALVEDGSVTDITWKICYETGKEYFTRGVKSKGKDFFSRAKHAMEYLGSLVTSPRLQEQFWTSCGRVAAMHDINSFLDSSAGPMNE